MISRKSALAMKYAQKHVKKHPEKHPKTSLFWVQCSSAAYFSHSYSQIANTLELTGRKDDKPNMLKLVYEHLSNEHNGPWFMVLDDVDDRTLLSMEYARRNGLGDNRPLSNFLPEGSHGSILITSRDLEVAKTLTGNVSSIITLHALDEADSTTLLLELSGDKNSPPKEAKRLAVCLDNQPLALTQAAAYISERLPEKNITKYLSSLQKPKSMKYQHTEIESDIQAVTKTWKLSFDTIRKKHLQSFELLALMSVFHFNDIPDVLFAERKKRYKNGSSDFEKNVVEPLIEYSLITRDGDKLSMHSVVHRLTKSWLQANHSSHLWVREAVAAIAENFPDISANPDRWSECHILLPHAESVLSMDSGPENFSQRKQRAELLYNIGYFKYVCGDYTSALKNFISAKKIYSEMLKPDEKEIERVNKMIIKLQHLLPRPRKKSKANQSRTTSNKVSGRGSSPNLPRQRHPRPRKQRRTPPSKRPSTQNAVIAGLCVTLVLEITFTFDLKGQLEKTKEGDENQDSRLQTLESWREDVYERMEGNRERDEKAMKDEERGEEKSSRDWRKWAENGMFTLAGWALSLLL